MIFETERLIFKEIQNNESDAFFDMMGNPNVMNPIPLPAMTKQESDAKLLEIISWYKISHSKRIWGIYEKKSSQFIGIGGLILNDEKDDELAYRLREKFWGIGYGTETAKGLIDFAFKELNIKKLAADVNIENIKSAKILDKFMTPVREFYCNILNCNDRRYELFNDQ